MRVYDVTGRKVRELINDRLTAGEHQVAWDGEDDLGQPLATGTYLYELRIDGQSVGRRKAVMLR